MRAAVVRVPGVHSWEQKLGSVPDGLVCRKLTAADGAPDDEQWVRIHGEHPALPDAELGASMMTLAQFRAALDIAAKGGNPYAGPAARTDTQKAEKTTTRRTTKKTGRRTRG